MSYQKFVFASDLHGDHQDPSAVKALLKFCDVWKPDIRVFGGDLWDFRPLRRKADDEERRESMKVDYAAGLQFLREFHPEFYLRGNHCLSDETELLTKDGFKPVTEVTPEDMVAQVNADGELSYAHPTALHKNDAVPTLIEITGPYTAQAVTHGHDVVVHGAKVKAASLLGAKLKASAISSGGVGPQAEPEDGDWLRLITWVVMDGTMVDGRKYGSPTSTKRRIQFKLSLEHKLTALSELLTRMGVPFTYKPATMSGINKLQPYYIRIYGDVGRAVFDYLGGIKKFPARWANLPKANLDAVLETILKTDGTAKDAGMFWVSTDFDNVNVIQTWCARHAVNTKWVAKDSSLSGFANGKTQYHTVVRMKERLHDSVDLKVEEVPYGRSVYCVTMPLGTIVVRYKGRTTLTGNCERLWDYASDGRGPVGDLAQHLVSEIEDEVRKLRCRMLPYHKRDGVLRLGHLKMLHGYACGIGAARKHAVTYGSCLLGHIHSIQHVTLERAEKTMARAVGALCRLDMNYNRSHIGSLSHAHGWAYGVVNNKTGEFHVWQAERVGDKFLCASEIITL